MSIFSAFAQKLLPHLNPEKAQQLVSDNLDWATTLGCTADITRIPQEDPIRVMGLRFPNRIGLAAGFDRAGATVSALGSFGFGHVEVGTVRPASFAPQAPRRIRRLAKERTIVESGEAAGLGLDAIAANLKSAQAFALRGGILGLSLASEDLNADVFKKAAPLADYLAINSVRTPPQPLLELLKDLSHWKKQADDTSLKPIPIALKLSPDLSESDFLNLLDAAAPVADALILTGSSDTGAADGSDLAANERLSGAPLAERSLAALSKASEHLAGALPLIASGGILSEKDCIERLEAGASLVQLFSGLIFNGPLFVADCVDAAARWAQESSR